MAKKKHYYTVSPLARDGNPFSFPEDMLRYDGASFASPKDEATANAEPAVNQVVALVANNPPNKDRWLSFSWRVVKTEKRIGGASE